MTRKPILKIFEQSFDEIEDQIVGIKSRMVLARERAGLTQTQAAQLVGMSNASSLSQHERMRSIPTLRLFLRLCAVYGVSPVWMLTGVNPDFDAQSILDAAGELSTDTLRIIDLLSSLDNKQS